MHEKHKVVKKYKKRKEKNIKLTTKKKRANEQRDGVTRCESPSPKTIKPITTKRRKQLIIRTIHILKHTRIMFSICTTTSTTVLNSKCLTSVSPTNSSNQIEDQTSFLVRPRKPQKIERRNIIIVEPSYNESTNDTQSPHNNICNTNQQNQTSYSSYYHQWESYFKRQSKQKKKLA